MLKVKFAVNISEFGCLKFNRYMVNGFYDEC